MRGLPKKILVNPTWEQIVESDPLIAFSFYLSGRKNVLLLIGEEIINNLDQAVVGKVVKGGQRRLYPQFVCQLPRWRKLEKRSR